MIETVGFTGTRAGMTVEQVKGVTNILLRLKPKKARHGVCRGADCDFHVMAKNQGIYVIGHPGVNRQGHARTRGSVTCDETLPEKFYLDRDYSIVDSCDVLIATPKGFEEELRSGTWTTIRYAQKTKRPYYIIWPDGEVYYRE